MNTFLKRHPVTRFLLFTFALIAVAGIICLVLINGYKGNDKIIFLDKARFTSVEDILAQPEFKNKVVYIDVWNTTCGPCMHEFREYTPKLLSRYKGKRDIAFLYICWDKKPLSTVLWKERIREMNLKGYHLLVNSYEDEIKLTKGLVELDYKGKHFPYTPFYAIADKQGKILDRSSGTYLKGELRPDDESKLYNKLDSVRNL